MKKHSTESRVSRRKLVLRLEHIVQLTPEQLRQVPGGSSAQDISCSQACSKPD